MSAAMSTAPPSALAPADGPTARRNNRLALLFAVILVTSLTAAALSLVSYLRPLGDGQALPRLTDIAQVRDFVWSFYVLAGVNLVVGVPALAVAGWILTPGRGAPWATVGGGLMWMGGAAYAVGIGGWAAIYYFASDTATLGTATASAFIDRINADTQHILLVPIAGALLVGVGGLVLAVGLWRARTIPRWLILIGSAASVATFLVSPSTSLGVAAESASAATSIGLGWYAWRGWYPRGGRGL